MFRCWSPAQRVVTGWFACIWHLTKSAWCDLPRHRCAAFIRTVFPISCIFLHVMQSIQSTEVYKEKAAYLATFKAEKHRQMLSDIHTTRCTIVQVATFLLFFSWKDPYQIKVISVYFSYLQQVLSKDQIPFDIRTKLARTQGKKAHSSSSLYHFIYSPRGQRQGLLARQYLLLDSKR